MAVPISWTAQQLSEFVAAVSSSGGEQTALRDAVERAATAFGADVAAIVGGGEVIAANDSRVGDLPRDELALVATGEQDLVTVPGVGRCTTLATPIDRDGVESLVLGRRGERRFSSEE